MQDRGVNAEDYHKIPEALNPEKITSKVVLILIGRLNYSSKNNLLISS